MNKVYIINYEETTVDEYGVLNTKTGTFDYAYADEAEAKKVLADVAQKRADEIADEDGKVDEWKGEAGDSYGFTVEHGNGTDCYEYRIYMVTVL